MFGVTLSFIATRSGLLRWEEHIASGQSDPWVYSLSFSKLDFNYGRNSEFKRLLLAFFSFFHDFLESYVLFFSWHWKHIQWHTADARYFKPGRHNTSCSDHVSSADTCIMSTAFPTSLVWWARFLSSRITSCFLGLTRNCCLSEVWHFLSRWSPFRSWHAWCSHPGRKKSKIWTVRFRSFPILGIPYLNN